MATKSETIKVLQAKLHDMQVDMQAMKGAVQQTSAMVDAILAACAKTYGEARIENDKDEPAYGKVIGYRMVIPMPDTASGDEVRCERSDEGKSYTVGVVLHEPQEGADDV